MNTTNMSTESTFTPPVKALYTPKTRPNNRRDTRIPETPLTVTTLSQRLAIGFAAGTVATVVLVLFSHVLSWFGPAPKGPVSFPVSFGPPKIYGLLFWGGLWGLLFGFFIRPAWNRLYLTGFLYFLVPLGATFFYFLPVGGAGYFGLKVAEPIFAAYITLVNVPFGITIALVARAIIGKTP